MGRSRNKIMFPTRSRQTAPSRCVHTYGINNQFPFLRISLLACACLGLDKENVHASGVRTVVSFTTCCETLQKLGVVLVDSGCKKRVKKNQGDRIPPYPSRA